MNQVVNKLFGGRGGLAGFVLLAILILIILPTVLDGFRLNLVGKYLTYAFVAVSLVLCWGYGGILSLGQGIFFGLGGYCMAMFLKLEASSPANTAIQSTPGIPDFMDWNQLTALPWFWKPFYSLPLTLVAIIALPTLFAWLISFALFKRRVGGVYFSIITQAIASILTILIIGQQGYTGGINGITDLRTLMQLGNREWPAGPGAVLAPVEDDSALAEKIRSLRSEGEVVVQQLPGQEGTWAEMNCTRMLRWNGSEWVVENV